MFPFHQDNHLLLGKVKEARRQEKEQQHKQNQQQQRPQNNNNNKNDNYNNNNNNSNTDSDNKNTKNNKKRPYGMIDYPSVCSQQGLLLLKREPSTSVGTTKRSRSNMMNMQQHKNNKKNKNDNNNNNNNNNNNKKSKKKLVTFSDTNEIIALPPPCHLAELNSTWWSPLDYERFRHEISATVKAIQKDLIRMTLKRSCCEDDPTNRSSERRSISSSTHDRCIRGLERQISTYVVGKPSNRRKIVQQVVALQHIQQKEREEEGDDNSADSSVLVGAFYSVLSRNHCMEALKIAEMDTRSIRCS